MKKTFLLLIFIVSFFGDIAYPFTLSNFSFPDSIIVDPEDGAYYISNVNGKTTEKQGKGYISKVSPSGNIIIQKYIGPKEEQQMNAPKGLLIIGQELYVTDIDVVRIFNKKTGNLVRVLDLSLVRARYLNAMAYDNRQYIYISDTVGNAIFRLDLKNDHQISIYHLGRSLGGPSGLVINPKSKNLMVASRKAGAILEIDRSHKVHIIKKGLSAPTGITYDEESYLYVSSFDKGEIYKIAKYGRGLLNTFVSGLSSPANISYDAKKNELLIPSYKGNTVTTLYRQHSRLEV